MKRKDLLESTFYISVNHSFSIIQIADSCCQHPTGGGDIYLYECVSLLTPEYPVSLCVYQTEYQHKTTYVSDLNKLEALLHKIHSKVLLVKRYKGSACVDP